jgi:hypothetical protein
MDQPHRTGRLQPLLDQVALSERSVRGQLGELLDRPCLFDADALREAAALLTSAAELADVVGRLPAPALLASGHAGARRSPRRRHHAAAAGQRRPDAAVVRLADRSRPRRASS